jgi:carboxymethylenebutenolidase
VLEQGSAERDRMRAVRTKMTIPPVVKDVAAMLDFIDRQSEVKQGQVGCHGYCMSGPYALAAAARYPERLATTASFYSTWLISDAEESPHLSLGRVKGNSTLPVPSTTSWRPSDGR